MLLKSGKRNCIIVSNSIKDLIANLAMFRD